MNVSVELKLEVAEDGIIFNGNVLDLESNAIAGRIHKIMILSVHYADVN
jgi:hypothetical protein